MPISLYKAHNGLKDSIGESVSYVYIIMDVPQNTQGDDAALRAFLTANIPTVENNIKLTGITIDEQLGNTTWKVTAEYKTDIKSFPNQLSRTFDTSGNTVHKSNSIKRVFSTIDEEVDKKGLAIGFNGEDVEGVDIGVAGFVFTEVHPIPDSAMTFEYEKALSKASWHVNDAPFRGYEAGEVLFKGVNGSRNGTEKYILTFNFEVIHNEENVTIGDIVIPVKKGWDYLSVRYEKQLSDDQSKIVVTQSTVTVDQVYPTADFATLGIGTDNWQTTVQKSVGDVENLLLSFPLGQ